MIYVRMRRVESEHNAYLIRAVCHSADKWLHPIALNSLYSNIYNFLLIFRSILIGFVADCWLVGFVALRPKSTAMVIAGRSVHLTTLFPGQA